MPDAASISVLRDVATLTWIALAIGVVAFRIWRVAKPLEAMEPRPGSWVDASAFTAADGIVVAALSMILLYGLNGTGDPEASQGEAGPDELTVGALVANAVFMLTLWTLLMGYLSFVRQLSVREVFGLTRMSVARAVGLGLLILIPVVLVVNTSAYLVSGWLEQFWTGLEPQNAVQAFRDNNQPGVRVMMVVFAVFIAPLVEETFFRGFIYPVFKKYTVGPYAAICSSLLFGLVHLHVGSLVPLVILALLLCRVYERTGSLIVPMVIHSGFNAISLIGLMLLEDGSL